jgi:hypothetical protein
LDAYVDQAIAGWGFEPQHYHVRRELEQDHEPRGIVVDTVIMHHPVTYVFFERAGRIYQLSARHNLGCMAPEIGFVNPEVFMQIVASFRFTS